MLVNSTAKKILSFLIVLTFVLIFALSPVQAEEFSLFGAKFGMTKEVIDSMWVSLGNGEYSIPGAPVSNVTLLFDHNSRLFQASFSVDLDFADPPLLVTQALQELINTKWGKEPDLEVSFFGTRGVTNSITVWNKPMRAAYIDHLKDQIAPSLQP